MLLSNNLPFNLMITKWASILNPIVSLPILAGLQIDNIVMASTTPVTINHKLGRTPQGWFPVDNVASAIIWRTQSFNSSTITLEASAATTISIWIY